MKAPAFIERGGSIVIPFATSGDARIAGVKAPAFIERCVQNQPYPACGSIGGIAGVKAPAFIERAAHEDSLDQEPNRRDCGGESPRLH